MPQVFDPPGNQASSEGDFPDLTFTATDPDGNPVTYSATGLPPGLSVDPIYGTVTGTIDYGDATQSTYQVTVTASNGRWPSGSTKFEWIVTPAAPSIDNQDAPQWDDMNNAEGESVSVPVEASDPDGLTLAFSATGLPPGLSIDPGTGLISGTISHGDDTGTPYDVTVSVTNGSQSSTLEFPWTIDRIALAAPSDQTDVVSTTVSLPIAANDESGKALTFSADGLPDGLAIDPTTGVISGTIDPTAADGMPYQVTVTATDGAETSDRTFNWSVSPVTLPTIVLANPGDQANATDDVISLQVHASTPDEVDTSELQYSATGLPPGLDIDPTTGVIAGFDEDWYNNTYEYVYTVTVQATDGYGQTASQTFHWTFAPGTAGSPTIPPPSPSPGGSPTSDGGGTSANAAGMPPPPAGAPAPPTQRPSTAVRSDAPMFSTDLFWTYVELYSGGTAAENWLLSKNGRVEWAWAGVTSYGRWEDDPNNIPDIPVVYIPQRYSEQYAAQAFIGVIRDNWLTGFGDSSNLPTIPDDIDGWRNYFKQLQDQQIGVVDGAAQVALAAATIVNEGADLIVSINDLQNAKTPGEVAMAAVCLLPFIPHGSVKIVSNAIAGAIQVSDKQAAMVKGFLKDYKGIYGNSTVFKKLVDQNGIIVIQRADIPYSKENVIKLMDGKAPFAKNASGEWQTIAMHHVEKQPQQGGVVAELLPGENHPANNLHKLYADGGVKYDEAWESFKEGYFRARLQKAIDAGEVPPSILIGLSTRLKDAGFTIPP